MKRNPTRTTARKTTTRTSARKSHDRLWADIQGLSPSKRLRDLVGVEAKSPTHDVGIAMDVRTRYGVTPLDEFEF